MELKHKKNCCETETTTTYDFQYPDTVCTYQTEFCINDIFSNPEICIPEGLTCEAEDYFFVRHVYFQINGNRVDILPNGSNLDYREEADRTTLKANIESYFSNLDYTTTVTIDYTDDCLSVEFNNLPSGYVPDYVSIHNTEICYVKSNFGCIDNVAVNPCKDEVLTNSCSEWTFLWDISECYVSPEPPSLPTLRLLDKIKFQLPDCTETVEKICIDSQVGSLPGEAPLEEVCEPGQDPGFIFYYCQDDVSVIDLQPLVDALEAKIIELGYTGTVTAQITAEHVLEVKFTGLDEGLIPLELHTLDALYKPVIISSECTTYEDLLPSCLWEASIDTTEENNIFSALSTILMFQPNLIAPVSLLSGSWTTNDIDTIKSLVAAYMTSNSISGSFDLTLVNNILTFSFQNLPDEYIPSQVIYINSQGTVVEVPFFCKDIEHIPAEQYNPDVIEWTGTCLELKPGLLGGTDTINDGVYSFELSIIDINNNIYLFKKCIFVDCCTKCQIANISDLKELDEAYKLYEAIKLAEDCNDCECENACNILKRLTKIIKVNTLKSGSNVSNCGCY